VAGARPIFRRHIAAVRPKTLAAQRFQFFTKMAESARKGPFSGQFRPKDAVLSGAAMVGSAQSGRRQLMRAARSETIDE
jgi:hypothetical protein